METTLKVTIRGTSPLIMHNGQLADPLNKFSKELKGVSGKRKKTDEDHAEMARIEWFGSLYVNEDGAAIIPSECLEASIYNGAKKQKLGKHFKSCVFVHEHAVLSLPTKKKKAVDLWGDDNYVDRRAVGVGQARVMRTRPIFRDWACDFVVHFDDEQVNQEEVERAIHDAGALVGVLDYRPKFGRFEVL